MSELKKLAVIVPVHNRREITLTCLRQMREISAKHVHLSLVIVDDGSVDGTAEAIRSRYPNIVILKGDGNLWWTGGINMGVKYVLDKGFDYALFLNDDLTLDVDFLDEVLRVASSYPEALVSSIKLNRGADGVDRIITAGIKVTGFLREMRIIHEGEQYRSDLPDIIECDMLTGASMLVPTSVFKVIGLLDQNKFPHHWGDLEFSHRASLAGFRCLTATRSRIYTEHNPNYPAPFFINSSRIAYLRSLFNSKRHIHGFVGLWRSSYMHRNVVIGTIAYLRRLAGLVKRVVMKLFLPNSLLREIVKEKD